MWNTQESLDGWTPSVPSSLHLPPLPKPTVVERPRLSSPPIKLAIAPPDTPEDSQPFKRPATGTSTDEEFYKPPRLNMETSRMPLQMSNGNAQSTVPNLTKRSDVDMLKAYAEHADDVRQAAPNNMVCQ